MHANETLFGDQLIVIEPHVSGTDPFTTAETSTRANLYGVGGIPHVQIDGKHAVIGSGNCGTSQYSTYINSRLAETGGISPIDITGWLIYGADGGTVSATFTLVDPGSYTNLRATIYVYDDNVFWCCGYGGANVWDETVRVVRTSFIDLPSQSAQVTLTENFDIPGLSTEVDWNLDELHAVAVIQESASPYTMIQGGVLPKILDYDLSFNAVVESVPDGNGEALFTGVIENVSTSADVVTLSVAEALVWSTDFQIDGDPTWYSNFDLPLAPGEIKGLTVRVATDTDVRIGDIDFTALSLNTGRAQPSILKVFNGSYAILLVEDDGSVFDYELQHIAALDNLGYLYTHYVVSGNGSDPGPKGSDMLGYDAIIWESGQTNFKVLNDGDQEALAAYIDAGGSLFFSSGDYTGTAQASNAFTADYLGLDSWAANTWADEATGVTGDPITDGMFFPLDWWSPIANRVDNLTPAAGAETILIAETGFPAAIRYQLGNGSRTVFSTILIDAISQTDPAPNNSDTLIGKILNWMIGAPTTDVPDFEAVAGTTRIIGANPNPFRPNTDLGFFLSSTAAAKPVDLSIIDASGRRVRSLAQGTLEAGQHQVRWDGTDDQGHTTSSGIYFARLKSADGETSVKLVYAK